MNELPTIGDVVRAWRLERQMSLTEFSEQTQLSKGYISELEHNKIDNPHLGKLERMAAALGISVRDILSRRMPDEVKDRDGQAVGQGQQSISSPLPTTANQSMGLPDILYGTRAEEVERRIASGDYTAEEEEVVWTAVFDLIERFNALKAIQRTRREEG